MEKNIDVIASLEQASEALFNWLKNNQLKSNIDKVPYIISTNKPIGIKIGD